MNNQPSPADSCATCVYSHPIINDGHALLECRCLPPNVVEGSVAWPSVDEDMICGQWKGDDDGR